MAVIKISIFAIISGFVVILSSGNKMHTKDFKVYYNIPTFMCKKFGVDFTNLTDKFRIIQNDNDSFRGNRISILYDPGKFPALLQNSSSKELFLRNGGIPQEGNLTEHLEILKQHINELIPDPENDGLAIIDFESWRPVYRQNFGALQPYKDLSIQMVRMKHWGWSQRRIEAEAARRFEEGANTFMSATIKLAKVMRPLAKWGYYGLPFCFNGRGAYIDDCAAYIKRENDGSQWLYDASDIIFPSVYMAQSITQNDRPRMVSGRVREAIRLAEKSYKSDKPKVLVYYRYVFTDTLNYLSESDTYAAINAMKMNGADGMVLWGSSYDLNTKQKCLEFSDYLENVLGPVTTFVEQTYSVEEMPPDLE